MTASRRPEHALMGVPSRDREAVSTLRRCQQELVAVGVATRERLTRTPEGITLWLIQTNPNK